MSAENEKWDVMVSYNWSTGKECANELDEFLTKHNYKVWIDKNNLGGNLYDEIAKGVANSEVILLLISEEYENSDNCISEYTYAKSCKKKIIPIQVTNYLPALGSGLDIIITGKIYYQLYENKEENMKQILKEIQNHFKKESRSKDISAVQDEQQAAGFKNDEFVLNQTGVCMKTQPGLDESCNKGISDTSNEKDIIKKPIKDLSGKFNHLNINENPNMPYERTDPDGSETKPIQSTSNTKVKKQQKSAATDLSVEDRKKFEDKLKLPLEEFNIGFGNLRKVLDVDDKVIRITDHLDISDEDCKSILLADHGGGNQPLSFLEHLKMSQPYRKIASVCKCLNEHSFIAAEKILTDNYNGEKTFSEVSNKHLRELSFQLIPSLGSNVGSWSDLASDLGIKSVDISLINNSGKRESNYSRTRNLFRIISMRFRQYTIGDFLGVLEELQLNDAHDLMIKKIIAEM